MPREYIWERFKALISSKPQVTCRIARSGEEIDGQLLELKEHSQYAKTGDSWHRADKFNRVNVRT